MNCKKCGIEIDSKLYKQYICRGCYRERMIKSQKKFRSKEKKCGKCGCEITQKHYRRMLCAQCYNARDKKNGFSNYLSRNNSYDFDKIGKLLKQINFQELKTIKRPE